MTDETTQHGDGPDAITKRIDAAIADERARCAAIVQEARHGERDNDLRCLIFAIEHP